MALSTPALGGKTARQVVSASLTRPDRDATGMAFAAALLLATLMTMLILFILLEQVITDAWPALSNKGLSFLTDGMASDASRTGIWPGLYGSFFIGLGVIIVAIPLGVAAAVYLEEYASQRNPFVAFVLVNIRNLAGVPAVIYGVLGVTIFVGWFDFVTNGKSVLAAALTMAVLVLPVVVITSMEAIRAVPQGLRDAGYGVGASRWEVTRDHVLPYAAPGILTGTVLSIARALGEAAPLILIGAITGLLPRTSLQGRFTALPMLIYKFTGEPRRDYSGVTFQNAAAAASVVLLSLVLIFNISAVLLRNRFEQRRAGD